MPLAATGALLTAAAARGEGVAAFDVLTLHHAQAVVRGAAAAGRPVIVQIGPDAVAHHAGELVPLARAVAALAEACPVAVALQLHRVRGTALLAQAAPCRFSSIAYDSSHLTPARDLAVTRDIVRWAHEQNLWVEAAAPRRPGGRAGRPGGTAGPTGNAPRPPGSLPGHRAPSGSDPEAALAYAAATGADALAVTLDLPGTHALDHALLARLHAGADLPLVLHARAGTPPHELARAVAGGVTEVGFGPVLDAVLTRAVRKGLATGAGPGDYLAAGRGAMEETVVRLMTAVNGPALADTSPLPSLS
ncbi:class II fructose-bisphosphate aldolase [Streptomyces sp. NPDC053367]|uniref:class II fructose-bisphosphate aldolase n=1 Tax=Streptomyces sp. NPDC053367 TaxID=3365700 RepID=UPI0037CEDE79